MDVVVVVVDVWNGMFGGIKCDNYAIYGDGLFIFIFSNLTLTLYNLFQNISLVSDPGNSGQ